MFGGTVFVGESPVNRLFDIIAGVLQKTCYGQEITLAEQNEYDQARDQWEKIACQKRSCPHRGDTCRFIGANLDWVRVLGHADLCELLHAKTLPHSFETLRTEWARRSGHFNP